MEYAAPETRMPTAASRDQKYRSLPYPNGWRRSAGRWERRSAVSKSTSVTESPTEWAASDSSAADPVSSPANAFSTAMPTLAASASRTVRRLSDCGGAGGEQERPEQDRHGSLESGPPDEQPFPGAQPAARQQPAHHERPDHQRQHDRA